MKRKPRYRQSPRVGLETPARGGGEPHPQRALRAQRRQALLFRDSQRQVIEYVRGAAMEGV
jgi:hypothetical protein